jgi:ATP-dependent Clp protease ATP-binding subunit ClpA
MMSRELERKLSVATEMAKSKHHEFVTLEHILYALSESPAAVEILQAMGVKIPQLKKELKTYMKEHSSLINQEQLDSYGGFESWYPEFTLACHRLFQRAALQVKSSGKNQITEGALLVALFYEQNSFAVYALSSQGVSQFDIINFISHGIAKDDHYSGLISSQETPELDEDGNFKTSGAETENPNSTKNNEKSKNNPLESFCTNLNEKALNGKIDPLIGREDVIERIVQILSRRNKNNPLLIGDPGVGKTAVIEGLASRVVKGDVPEKLKNMEIYALDLGSMLAGTKFRGDFEGRLKAVLKEIRQHPRAILFIDEIHTLIGAGATSGGSMDASNLLKPALANGDLSCIGSTTYQEFRQFFEKDRALNRRFQKIDIKEPSREDSLAILRGLKKTYEDFHHVTFTEDAILAAVDLSIKHIQGKTLPDKAIDLIDETGARLAGLPQTENSAPQVVDAKEIEITVAKIAQIPSATVSSNDKEVLKDLSKNLKALIFGQDEAIDKLVTSIKMARTGLLRENKPIGSFLFAGPTGVGKTEVCRQLALLLGIPLQRFDMSEYMEKHTVARLVGAPPGYVGFEEGGLLTEAINKTPFCVLLLDEMEKAHPDINNILLQIMDAGRLTDANGRVSDFKNVILIMTSNAGAMDIAKGNIGIVQEQRGLNASEALKKIFAPEFINRLDSVVYFKDLDESIILKVVSKFVDELKMQLQNKNVDLQVSEIALKWLMQKGYDKVYGARPLARTIDEHLKKPLVDDLLFGRLTHGGRVLFDVQENALEFKIVALT